MSTQIRRITVLLFVVAVVPCGVQRNVGSRGFVRVIWIAAVVGMVGIKPSDQKVIRNSMHLTISPNLLFAAFHGYEGAQTVTV
jgi:hypothetical protein